MFRLRIEVREGQRRVVVLEQLVRQVGVGHWQHPLRIFAPDRAVGRAGIRGLAHGGDQLPHRRYPLGMGLDAAGMQQHRVADGLPQPPAGQDVEAHRDDAARCQPLLADRHQRVAQRLGDPAEHAVAEDVVEAGVARAEIGEAPRCERDVAQAEPGDARLALRHLHRRHVDADEPRVRQGGRQRDQMAGRGAADLQRACRARVRRRMTEQPCRRAQPCRVQLRIRNRHIRHRVIVPCRAGRRLVCRGSCNGGLAHRHGTAPCDANDAQTRSRAPGLQPEARSCRHCPGTHPVSVSETGRDHADEPLRCEGHAAFAAKIAGNDPLQQLGAETACGRRRD